MIRYAQNRQIAWRAIEEEAVLIDPADGTVFVLNGVGLRIWALLEEALSSAEISSELAVEFPSETDRLDDDISGFLSDLIERELIIEEHE